MLRIIQNIFLVLLISAFVFPIEFTFLPGVNTKLILSLIGLMLFMFQSARYGTVKLDNGFVGVIILALLFSLVCLLSVVYNYTNDYTYATYIISMLVWLFGAYAVVWCIREVYGRLSIPLVSNLLIGCAVFQCLTALLIEYIPAFSNWVDSIMLGVGFQKGAQDIKGERLYGIGALLDVAGMRFSCILAILTVVYTFYDNKSNNKWMPYLYVACFLFISCIGNMMSRTTIVGMAIALAYWLYEACKGNRKSIQILKCFIIVLIISIPLIIYLYNTNDAFYNKFRFGFEGFFSLAEQGEWHTNSGDKLESMFKVPDNIKTWIIGDGYFENVRRDPYYIGYNWLYFYMGTDVGYSRFLFYCGFIGLFAFSLFFIGCAAYLMKRYPKYKVMFFLILCINFIAWIKVSSDCFSLFAIYLACSLFFDEMNGEGDSGNKRKSELVESTNLN